jgi:hypothetical protein
VRRLPDLPRSTQRGSLTGAARAPHQTRSVPVVIEEVRPGVMQLSTPFGWKSGLAYNAPDLARMVASAFVEAQIHNHSMWKGYDEAGRPMRSRPRPQNPGKRWDVHHPGTWRLASDGFYISPSGRRWHPDSQLADRVRRRRVEYGLPEIPDQMDPSDARVGLLGKSDTG